MVFPLSCTISFFSTSFISSGFKFIFRKIFTESYFIDTITKIFSVGLQEKRFLYLSQFSVHFVIVAFLRSLFVKKNIVIGKRFFIV